MRIRKLGRFGRLKGRLQRQSITTDDCRWGTSTARAADERATFKTTFRHGALGNNSEQNSPSILNECQIACALFELIRLCPKRQPHRVLGMSAAEEAARMPTRIIKKPLPRKIVFRLPDLDHSKSSVLNSLSSPRSRRNYKFAMEQFISWYCSEPRLALNRTVVLRFRLHLESLGLAAGTINQRLAAVRRLAYKAADSGLLSPDLAAGIRRVKGVKQLGCRAGNWLNREQAQSLLEKADGLGLRNVRDAATIKSVSAVACAGRNWQPCERKIFKFGRGIGLS
jgi:hypothetical protein